jgi:Fe-S oxidoreductase
MRPMRALPVLERRRDALEKCVFCPKLCRSACPVSNAEPRETITPWGKMSMAYFAAHGDVPLDASHAAPARACTGCYACRESCDHRNDVASTLYDARAALTSAGQAPAAAARVGRGFAQHRADTRKAVRELRAGGGVRDGAKTAVLVGCAYARGASPEARDAAFAARALAKEDVALVEECCGLPLLLAGDADGFARQAGELARATKGAESIVVVDAGCAHALRVRYPAAGVTLAAEIELLVERASRMLGELSVVAGAGEDGPVRYHDPCQLGRGLGVFDAPRAVLSRALGRAPDEFFGRRERAACSGAGGLLPATMPETSRAIADARLAEHAEAGGGRIVTACASSLLSLRRRAPEGVVVEDIVTYVARSLRRS